jgi:hypothetical protein
VSHLLCCKRTGMLVVASSIRLKLVLRQFRFMSKMFGRGLLYIFVGSYYLNVVSGGFELAITTFLLDPLSIEGALPLVAGGLIFLSGVVFVLIHVCWCYEGCLEDGSEDIEADLEDMTDTPLKRRAKWLDYLLRLVTVCIGGFLCRCSVDIYLEHFDGCVGVDPEATCHAKLNRYSLMYVRPRSLVDYERTYHASFPPAVWVGLPCALLALAWRGLALFFLAASVTVTEADADTR